MSDQTPEGFELFNANIGFIETTGPLYVKYEDGQAYCGLRIGDRHCNLANICHGGMLMTFAGALRRRRGDSRTTMDYTSDLAVLATPRLVS